MVNPQHATGRAESPTSDPETLSMGLSDEPTLYEFLTHLVSSPAARSAFDADPQAALDQVGLGGMTATDVLQATSLVLDYAPVEVVTHYDRSLQSSIEHFAASTQHVAIDQLHPAHPIEQEELSMLKPSPAQTSDYSASSDVDAILPAPAPATAGSGDVNIDIEQNDSHNLISIHDNNIATDNIVGNIVGNTVGSVGDSLDLSSATNVVSEINATATQIWDDSLDVTVGAAEVVHGDVTGIAGDVVNGDALGIVENAPLIGELNVTGVLGSVTEGDVTSIVNNAPIVGDVAGNLTSVVANVPVAGDLVGGIAGGDITNVTSVVTEAPLVGDVVGGVVGGDITDVTAVTGVVGDVTAVAGSVPVVGDVVGTVGGVVGDVPVAGDLVGGIAGGDVHALPVDDVTSALPLDDVTSALPLDDVTSALPVETVTDTAASLPLAGPVVGDVAGVVGGVADTATSTLPLDGLL